MGNWVKIGVLVAICLIPLFIIPAYAITYSVSVPEDIDPICETLLNDKKEVQEYYQSYEVQQDEQLKINVLGQIKELTDQLNELCSEPEPELIQEATSEMRAKATIYCSDRQDSHRQAQQFGSAGSQYNFNYQKCVDEHIKYLQSQPEPEPVKTADDVYKMICSSPDGYCMSQVGMNNPDAYGACLGRWVPFCRTYEAKQTPDTNSEITCGTGTIEKDGFCVPERATMTTEMQQKSSNGGGCLIATATFGSELAPQVQMIREIRDNSLLQTQSGQSFMESFNSFYYSFSPTIADYERQNPVFKETVKLTITPLLASLSLLNYVDLDSEESVLGYGIGIILMNVGMYFVAPVMVIHRIKKILNS